MKEEELTGQGQSAQAQVQLSHRTSWLHSAQQAAAEGSAVGVPGRLLPGLPELINQFSFPPGLEKSIFRAE